MELLNRVLLWLLEKLSSIMLRLIAVLDASLSKITDWQLILKLKNINAWTKK
jgi:hypothetical protein